MANIKRRMKRKQRNREIDFSVSVWCENGELFVNVETDFWGGGAKVAETKFPDGNMPWLAEKIVARIEKGPCMSLLDILSAANQVIHEETGVETLFVRD